MTNETLMFIATIIPVTLVVMVIVVFVMFIRKKNKLLIEKQEREIRYLSEINKARIEVKDGILSQVAGELHDNIGQMVALNLMYTKSLQKEFNPEKLESMRDLAESTLNEVRQLSKLLNDDLIQKYDLVAAVEKLVSYLSKLNAVEIVFVLKGDYHKLDANLELIIYRICQEFIANSLKHALCDRIDLTMQYRDNRLEVSIADNGNGFDLDSIAEGTGLIAIRKRAEIINAQVTIVSALKGGTRLQLIYNFA
ncbi:MAG: hypothetical protein EOP54_08365 [Sphingobacteriales bacterium]|nr:MAG: hypothetical protein EOP54_08365 [Sphingobacteriales bacterium]